MERTHGPGDDEGDGREGDLDGVGDVQEGLGQPGEGIGAEAKDGDEGREGGGVRQGEVGAGREGDGSWIMVDCPPTGTVRAPAKDRGRPEQRPAPYMGRPRW